MVTQAIILGPTSLTVNNKIHILVTIVMDSLNSTNNPSLNKIHRNIEPNLEQQSTQHQQQQPQHGAFMHQTEITFCNRDNQNLTMFGNNQIK